MFSFFSMKLKYFNIFQTSRKVLACLKLDYFTQCISCFSGKWTHNAWWYPDCVFLFAADIISTVEFNHSGELLATGDKGGRVVIFQQEPEVKLKANSWVFVTRTIAQNPYNGNTEIFNNLSNFAKKIFWLHEVVFQTYRNRVKLQKVEWKYLQIVAFTLHWRRWMGHVISSHQMTRIKLGRRKKLNVFNK